MTATITARPRGPHQPASLVNLLQPHSNPQTYTENGPGCTSRQEMQIVWICLCSAQLEMKENWKNFMEMNWRGFVPESARKMHFIKLFLIRIIQAQLSEAST